MRYMITDEMWVVIEECLAQAKIEKRADPQRFPTASSSRPCSPCSMWRERGFPGEIYLEAISKCWEYGVRCTMYASSNP
jgi:hypothetical protein